MYRAGFLALFTCLLVLSGGSIGQDKKDEPKKDDKKTDKKDDKKDDTPAKMKGVLPQNWKKLGLTDVQVQDIYKVQNKYNEEIAKLDAKIKELKTTRDKEEKAILTPEQKKRLEEILIGKDKEKDKDKDK
jgi:septal ring factor EnvC (AmiA/AmiB activator)